MKNNSLFLAEIESLISYADKIKNQEIGVYKDVALIIKRLHLMKAIDAVGGKENLTLSDLGIIGNILKKQYYQGKDEQTGKKFGLKHLFKEAKDQSIPQIVNRLKMYVSMADLTASTLIQKRVIIEGKTEMKRILSSYDRACPDCVAYSLMGWQKIGLLPLPKTKCQCRANCRCVIEYN